VGTQTVLDDNPKLNVRDWSGNQPIRIVIDRTNRIPKESYIFNNQLETIIFTETELRSASEKIKYIKIDFSANVVQQIVSHLYQLAIQSVLIEGGKITLQSFIDANLWDEARIFKGTIAFSDGVKAPELEVKNGQKTKIGKEELQLFRNYDNNTII
jgi:diaminohydroxyphosphoribosylaminopyrimidine deaminase/5-amino-6-(5-phosphoribosylamino)uracil reductase